jgi:hypothetical protein
MKKTHRFRPGTLALRRSNRIQGSPVPWEKMGFSCNSMGLNLQEFLLNQQKLGLTWFNQEKWGFNQQHNMDLMVILWEITKGKHGY